MGRRASSATVSGTIVAVDGKLERVIVRDLRTPIGVYSHATVRMQDIVCLEVEPPP